MGKVYGYARVSAKDQNLDRQMGAFADFGVDEVYTDKASGKDFERPGWQRLMSGLRKGDTIVVKSIDRLGRNYSEVLDVWRHIIKDKGASIVVLDMPLLDTRTRSKDITNALISDIVLQLLSYIAQVERENIRQRQAEGIAAARARGVHLGRPRKPKPACYEQTKESYRTGSITRKEAAERMQVCVSTFDRWLREEGA